MVHQSLGRPEGGAVTSSIHDANRRPVRIVDTSLRDGNQSLWGATGITTGMAEAVGPALDAMGLEAIDFTSSTHLGMGVKIHRENPWERLSRMRTVTPNTPLSAITTGMRFISWERASEAVFRMSLRMLAKHGLRRLQIAEPMNDVDVTLRVAQWAKEEGIEQVVAAVVFTESPVHTDERYRLNAERYAASPFVDAVYLKDPGGLLTDARTRELIPLLRAATGETTLELHSHCTTGSASQLYLTAAELGVDVLHTGLGPLSNGTAQPSLENLMTNLDTLGIPVDIDRAAAVRAADILTSIADAQGLQPGRPTEYDLSSHVHQVPGGMMGTLRRQLGEIGMLDKLPAVIEEAGRVRAELGYPIMVTPFSQFVGSQALMNVLAVGNGEDRYSRIPDEVIRFVLGTFGTPEGPIDDDVLSRVHDMSRTAELSVDTPEKSLDELHAQYASQFGRDVPDEELLLRVVMPTEQVETMLAAGAAPSWPSTGRAADAPRPPVTSAAEFIKEVDRLPRWRSVSVRFGGNSISLHRPNEGK
jgi:oxaloacetate decarboxylase (Na+ extruding) subunit alpha